jgi:hypothetical protein
MQLAQRLDREGLHSDCSDLWITGGTPQLPSCGEKLKAIVGCSPAGLDDL